ncbi:TauD/TfdA family dioxygenase (plasmid) [Rhodococcoides fascians A21d2]|uniref:TauD/TfdA family dioxygenase n=1 Tax=Rhodococcoides fascians TaxID=1828 RepID=UPI00056150A7|nr:TauD/TfdA family dioxygenase [Rhodococcus fascians]QII03662.1 TauD/TfdA family dioxygenase [Rhodococcus fascians A21d2]
MTAIDPGDLAAVATRDVFALVGDVDFGRSDFEVFVQELGTLATHRFGTGSAGLLDLDASPLPDRVVTGRSALPLHTDGTLVGTCPKYIVLYCNAVDQPTGSGRTELCLQSELLDATLPPDLSTVTDVDWEYYVTDQSHFPDVAHRWLSIPPAMRSATGTTRLNVALPFTEKRSTPAGWAVRLAGSTEEDSRAVFARLDSYLRGSASFYAHDWARGDLLVLDNELVLHGRTTIEPGSVRHLFRGQINV